MNIDQILSCRVSFQRSVWGSLDSTFSIEQVLNKIKEGAYRVQVERLRTLLNSGNSEAYAIHKKNLPAVTFCGTFIPARKREFLKEYNHLVVIDIDNLTESAIIAVKESLKTDDYVLTFWDSPSQQGVKGLVSVLALDKSKVNNTDAFHKYAFQKLATYFKSSYDIDLDISGSDTTRLCFYSYDPSLLIKDNATQFEVDYDPEKLTATPKYIPIAEELKREIVKPIALPKKRNHPESRKTIQSILKYLKKRNLSITSSYEEWYRVGYSIANTFTPDLGEKYYLALCELDGAGHSEQNSKNMLRYCYENSNGEIKFNSLIYYANSKGYSTTAQKRKKDGT